MQKPTTSPPPSKRFFPLLWDAFCLLSFVGIWPRFIEPNLLRVQKVDFPIKSLPASLEGRRVVQFSDLHLFSGVPECFLRRLQQKILALSPDILLFTGDFLCYSKVREGERLQKFLAGLHAKYGCFAILGNHDYDHYVGINDVGDYDILDRVKTEVLRGMGRLLFGQTLRFDRNERLEQVQPHPGLVDILKHSPFTLLENTSRLVPIDSSSLNICGLGEYMADRFDPGTAFKHYDSGYPGIIMAHNPDCIDHLEGYPGEVILCGHVHGGQVNLPWVRDRVVLLENKKYIRGTFDLGNRRAHINRGVGGAFRFRLFSIPEITLGVLRRA